LKQFPISISTRSGDGLLHLFGDRPDEARQLTRDRGNDHRRLLSCPGELAIPSAQPQEINGSRRLRSACVAPHRYRPW
jgi:hypothetical protein